MKFVAILVLSVSTICIVADVDVKRHGGGGGGGGGWFRRCRVVANGTTDCAGVTGSDCRDSTALAVSCCCYQPFLNGKIVWRIMQKNWCRKIVLLIESSSTYLVVNVFSKMGPSLPLFYFIFVFSKKHYIFYNKYRWRNIHPVYTAGIQTHDLQDMSLLS